mgnify:CR=1 FL=1
MGRLKVDFIVGRRFPEITGIDRYARELIGHCGGELDGRIIDYDLDFPLPGLERLPALLYYPLVVARRRRVDSVKHLCSHIQAQLLNYLRLEPSVVTCYDIYPYLEREYPATDRAMVRLGLRGMMKADRVIAISRFTREEIAVHLGFPRERIHVTHLGVDHARYRPLPCRAGEMERYGVPAGKRVLLYVGSEQPRKNLPTLFRAFAAAREEREDVVLLKGGRPQWKGAREKLLRLAERLGIRDDVFFADFVPEEDLPSLYASANLFVFPSLYEGFGLPPLEAMACGCPVVCSNVTSLPEVVGKAALTVDPLDVEGLAEAILRVLGDDDLRERLVGMGIERAAKFSWQETARKTMEAYIDLLHYR